MTSLLSIQYVTPTKLVDNSSCSTFKTAVQLPEMYQVRNMTTANQRRSFVEGVHNVTAVKSPPLNHNRLAYVDALVGKVKSFKL
jgi:hypothetical protein